MYVILKKLTTDAFVERACSLHGDRYDYSRVNYVSMNVPVEIVCSKHGPFFQSPNNHLKGHGCSLCTRVDGRKLPVSTFLEKARDVHGDKYDYSQVVYVNSKTHVSIVCPKHGVFLQTPNKHLSGRGCPRCRPNFADTLTSFVEKARDVHGALYDYSLVQYVDTYTKVHIVDPKYGDFWQTPNAHLRGEGHPRRKGERCYLTKKENGTLNSSKSSDRAGEMLRAKFGADDVLAEYRSERYPFACDYYIKSLDLYIEFNLYVTHGGHWFDSNSDEDRVRLGVLQERADWVNRNLYANTIRVWTGSDLVKRQTAIENNLNYVVFWDNDLSDFLAWYNSFDELHVLKQF